MKLLEVSPEAINAAIRRFEESVSLSGDDGEVSAEAEHLFACEEVRDYIPVIADRLRAMKTGEEQWAVLFALLHLGINAGLHLGSGRE